MSEIQVSQVLSEESAIKNAIFSGDYELFQKLLGNALLEEYSKEYSLYEYILSKAPLSFVLQVFKKYKLQEKDQIFLACRILRDKTYNSFSEEEIIEDLSGLVSSENVNALVNSNLYKEKLSGGGNYSSLIREHQYSILFLAFCLKKMKVAEWLLKEKKATPILTISEESTYRTEQHLLMDKLKYFGKSQKHIVAVITLLLKYQANFNQRFEGLTIWNYILNNYSGRQIEDLFQYAVPEELEDQILLQRRFTSLHDKLVSEKKIKYENYPYLNNLLWIEKRKVKLVPETSKRPRNWEMFFKEESFLEALKQRYGFASPRLVKIFENFIVRKPQDISFNLVSIIYVDLIAQILLDDNKDSFLEILEKVTPDIKEFDLALDRADLGNEELEELGKLVNKIYNLNQKKQFFLNFFKKHSLHYVKDTIRNWQQYSEELLPYFNAADTSELDSIEKLHDFTFSKVALLKIKNFPLKQEEHFPQLVELSTKPFFENYGIKVAVDLFELINWGETMNHCIGTSDYGSRAAKGEIILLAITLEENPQFAVEISPRLRRILQVQGKNGEKPEGKVVQALENELKRLLII